MEYVIKKTYLGLALEEVLKDLELEHMTKDIGEHFKAAFLKNFDELTNNFEPVVISGV